MTEKRKPDASMFLRTADGSRCQYEIFRAEQFADRMVKVPFFHAENPNLQILPVDLETADFVRVRVNGSWLPRGQRSLFPLHRVSFLIAQHLQQGLRRSKEE